MGSRRKANDSVCPPTISRRAIVSAGVAAGMMNGFGKHRCAEAGCKVARSNFDSYGTPDRNLSRAFLDNANGFHRGAGSAHASPEIAFHSLAIAVELSLKAYLLHVGVSDEWNRIHVGHDLLIALACARHAGLRDAPEYLVRLAAELTPFYQRHPAWPKTTQSLISSPLASAHDTTGRLIWTVAEQIGCAGIAVGKEGT